jgi:hypothetical protein
MSRSDGFGTSYLALLAALWSEFEALLSALPSDSDEAAPGRAEGRAEIVRLELVLLRDACERPPARALLAPEQRFRVRALVDDLRWLIDLAAPAVATSKVRTALERAQNRLYDEVRYLALEASAAQRRVG